MSIKDIPTQWDYREFLKKFIPCLLTAASPLVMRRVEDLWEWASAIIYALGAALAVDAVTFSAAKKPDDEG